MGSCSQLLQQFLRITERHEAFVRNQMVRLPSYTNGVSASSDAQYASLRRASWEERIPP